jgi:hypothetical protein
VDSDSASFLLQTSQWLIHMHCVRLQLASCLIALVLLPSTSVGQDDWTQPWSDSRDRPPRVDVSASAGLLLPGDWSDLVLLGSISSLTGVLEQVLVRDLRVEPNAVFGSAVTYWRGKYGMRVTGGFCRSSLVIGGTPLGEMEPDDILSGDVDVWFYDVRGAVGLQDYRPGRRVWPYAFVGVGGITYDMARPVRPPLLTFIERSVSRPFNGNGDIVIVGDLGEQFVLAVDELNLETVLALSFGVGSDFRIPLGRGGIGLRLEVSDHLAESPVGLRIRELTPAGGLTSESAVRFGGVHHLRATASVVVQFGK